MRKHDLEKTTSKDIAYAVTKAAVGSVPVIGAAATELLSLIVASPLEKRRNKFLTEIGQRLRELEESKRITIESLSENEHFVDTVLQATAHALKRALYNGKPGIQVISTFVKGKALQGMASQFGGTVTNGQVKDMMAGTIGGIGLEKVTNHAQENPNINAIDVAPSSIDPSNQATFQNAASSHPDVHKLIPLRGIQLFT